MILADIYLTFEACPVNTIQYPDQCIIYNDQHRRPTSHAS